MILYIYVVEEGAGGGYVVEEGMGGEGEGNFLLYPDQGFQQFSLSV